MMVNFIHYLTHRPERGWDPIAADYAAAYAQNAWSLLKQSDIDGVVALTGDLRGKTVLDLGAGPGHGGISFAKLGARVTWYDVSENYRRVAEGRARLDGVDVQFVVGYMDDAPRVLGGRQFDFVFCAGCWNYSISDTGFAGVLYSLTAPGGSCYVDLLTSRHQWNSRPTLGKIRTWLYERTGLKVGHPFTPHGKAARCLLKHPVRTLAVDYRSQDHDRIFFTRASV